jgi:hypothetical protein
MKLSKPSIASLYDKKKPKKSWGITNFFLFSLLVILILLAIRFANVSLIWQLNRLELRHNPMVDIQNFTFLGLSTRETATTRLKKISDTHSGGVAIVSYYTFSDPAGFLINNPGPPLFIDIGRMAVFIKPGVTWIQISLEDMIEMEWNQSRQMAFMGFSIFSFLVDGSPGLSGGSGRRRRNFGSRISYVENPVEKTKYLKISGMIYFFLPMLFIFWLSSGYGKGFYTAFLYYVVFFFLFDFRKAFVTVPFYWVFDIASWEISDALALGIALFILIIFLIFALVGISNSRSMEDKSWGKRLVFIFILLPLFIRF